MKTIKNFLVIFALAAMLANADMFPKPPRTIHPPRQNPPVTCPTCGHGAPGPIAVFMTLLESMFGF